VPVGATLSVVSPTIGKANFSKFQKTIAKIATGE